MKAYKKILSSLYQNTSWYKNHLGKIYQE